MRGKLRDKHTIAKREHFKRDLQERRRLAKRENRTMVWLNQQMNAAKDDDLSEENEDELLEKK